MSIIHDLFLNYFTDNNENQANEATNVDELPEDEDMISNTDEVPEDEGMILVKKLTSRVNLSNNFITFRTINFH